MSFGEDQGALWALVPPLHAAVVALEVVAEEGLRLERLFGAAVGARVPLPVLMVILIVILQRPYIYQDLYVKQLWARAGVVDRNSQLRVG